MSDPIQIIADKIINEKQHVVLYGAGNDAILIIHELKRQYSILPSYICDSDKTKWHKSLLGVEILSIDEALSIYPDLYLFISAIMYKHQIIWQLLASGKIDKERILNFEPVVKRKSCVFVESQLVAYGHTASYCCSDFGKSKSPSVEYKDSCDTFIDDYLNFRDKLIYDFNHSIPTSCDGCPYLTENYFPLDKKIRWLNYSEGGICNYKCCYCTSEAKTNQSECVSIELPELINKLEARGLLDEELHTSIACGEISIQPRKKEIYQVIRDKYNCIFSNSSVYDPQIAYLIKNGKGVLDTSVDAGTRETYAKVKGFDLFEQVRTNLYRYANEGGKGSMELKYIFLPGINDNEADIDGFVELCRYVEPCSIVIAHDLHYTDDLPSQTIDMAAKLVKSLTNHNLFYKIVSNEINYALKA